jgi:thiol-disulfide isomerase/thioredoxin
MIYQKKLITVGLLILMLTGFGLIYSVFSDSGATVSTQSKAQFTPPENQIAAVNLPTLDGKEINLLEDRGEVTILFAMSYWCTTCVPEARALAQLVDKYEGQGLRVIVIDLDPTVSPEHLQGFIDEVGENRLIWAFDPEAAFMWTYNVRALDTTIVVNADGYEVYRDIRSTPYSTLQKIVEQWL